ncbi:MAG: hypothetical protein KBG92_05560 [Spirochaetes bacterium]|jgi:mRNA interferase RelE/StbE|nr:hypothetical protein [Spirochaetota bacterium]HQQ49657.1 hypothetical protein [Spirochaetota bacterium]
MTWTINYSKDAKKFIDKQNVHNDVVEALKKLILKIQGNNVNIDLKKLYGDWDGYYRLRRGKLRIIIALNKSNRQVYVEKIDFRGDVYK